MSRISENPYLLQLNPIKYFCCLFIYRYKVKETRLDSIVGFSCFDRRQQSKHQPAEKWVSQILAVAEKRLKSCSVPQKMYKVLVQNKIQSSTFNNCFSERRSVQNLTTKKIG
jgi:hypothetical protein